MFIYTRFEKLIEELGIKKTNVCLISPCLKVGVLRHV